MDRQVALLLATALGAGLTSAAGAQQAASRAPDLVAVSIEFTVVERAQRPDGRPCEIYNVISTIGNRGTAPAGAFKVRLERKKGGSWTEGCPTCSYELRGLPNNQTTTLDARQANSCGDPPWNDWQLVVDSAYDVRETREDNNVISATYVPVPRPPAKAVKRSLIRPGSRPRDPQRVTARETAALEAAPQTADPPCRAPVGKHDGDDLAMRLARQAGVADRGSGCQFLLELTGIERRSHPVATVRLEAGQTVACSSRWTEGTRASVSSPRARRSSTRSAIPSGFCPW